MIKMKNKVLGALLVGATTMATAQVSVAMKANMLFNTGSASWKNISSTASNAYNEKGKNKAGYNVGLSLKVPLMQSFFLMPELYYTTFKNEFTDPATGTALAAKSNRVDLPVLVGANVLGEMLGVFVGPVASYNLSKDNQFNDFKENAAKQFTVGYQFGGQVQLRKILVNARYEGAFSKDQRDFISNATSSNSIRYDNRPSLFIVGLGYKF